MRQWKFNITEEAQLDLNALDIQTKRRVLAKLSWMVSNFEYVTPIPLGEPLKGFFNLVTVHAIQRRDKIYKKLSRRK